MERARSIRVQGSSPVCINALRKYANDYNVRYVAVFCRPGMDPQRCSVFPDRDTGDQQTIVIYLNWRCEYGEYDNSL
jgi:hypothetical protein